MYTSVSMLFYVFVTTFVAYHMPYAKILDVELVLTSRRVTTVVTRCLLVLRRRFQNRRCTHFLESPSGN